MSRDVKYLGSNSQPVLAETVETNTNNNPLNYSNEESTMTVINPTVKTTVESTVTEAAVNTVVTESTELLAELQEAKSPKNKLTWVGIVTTGVTTGILVGTRLIVEHMDDDKFPTASVVSQSLGCGLLASGTQALVQALVPKINNGLHANALTTTIISSSFNVAHAMVGDRVVPVIAGGFNNMFSSKEELTVEE